MCDESCKYHSLIHNFINGKTNCIKIVISSKQHKTEVYDTLTPDFTSVFTKTKVKGSDRELWTCYDRDAVIGITASGTKYLKNKQRRYSALAKYREDMKKDTEKFLPGYSPPTYDKECPVLKYTGTDISDPSLQEVMTVTSDITNSMRQVVWGILKEVNADPEVFESVESCFTNADYITCNLISTDGDTRRIYDESVAAYYRSAADIIKNGIAKATGTTLKTEDQVIEDMTKDIRDNIDNEREALIQVMIDMANKSTRIVDDVHNAVERAIINNANEQESIKGKNGRDSDDEEEDTNNNKRGKVSPMKSDGKDEEVDGDDDDVNNNNNMIVGGKEEETPQEERQKLQRIVTDLLNRYDGYNKSDIIPLEGRGLIQKLFDTASRFLTSDKVVTTLSASLLIALSGLQAYSLYRGISEAWFMTDEASGIASMSSNSKMKEAEVAENFRNQRVKNEIDKYLIDLERTKRDLSDLTKNPNLFASHPKYEFDINLSQTLQNVLESNREAFNESVNSLNYAYKLAKENEVVTLDNAGVAIGHTKALIDTFDDSVFRMQTVSSKLLEDFDKAIRAMGTDSYKFKLYMDYFTRNIAGNMCGTPEGTALWKDTVNSALAAVTKSDSSDEATTNLILNMIKKACPYVDTNAPPTILLANYLMEVRNEATLLKLFRDFAVDVTQGVKAIGEFLSNSLPDTASLHGIDSQSMIEKMKERIADMETKRRIMITTHAAQVSSAYLEDLYKRANGNTSKFMSRIIDGIHGTVSGDVMKATFRAISTPSDDGILRNTVYLTPTTGVRITRALKGVFGSATASFIVSLLPGVNQISVLQQIINLLLGQYKTKDGWSFMMESSGIGGVLRVLTMLNTMLCSFEMYTNIQVHLSGTVKWIIDRFILRIAPNYCDDIDEIMRNAKRLNVDPMDSLLTCIFKKACSRIRAAHVNGYYGKVFSEFSTQLLVIIEKCLSMVNTFQVGLSKLLHHPIYSTAKYIAMAVVLVINLVNFPVTGIVAAALYSLSVLCLRYLMRLVAPVSMWFYENSIKRFLPEKVIIQNHHINIGSAPYIATKKIDKMLRVFQLNNDIQGTEMITQYKEQLIALAREEKEEEKKRPSRMGYINELNLDIKSLTQDFLAVIVFGALTYELFVVNSFSDIKAHGFDSNEEGSGSAKKDEGAWSIFKFLASYLSGLESKPTLNGRLTGLAQASMLSQTAEVVRDAFVTADNEGLTSSSQGLIDLLRSTDIHKGQSEFVNAIESFIIQNNIDNIDLLKNLTSRHTN